MSDGPLTATADGVRVAVRLSPRARTDRIDGVVSAAAGRLVLKAAVAAPPQDGRANDALLALLASAWDIPRRDLAIVAGAASRNKTVHVAGDAPALMARLRDRVTARSPP